MRTFGKVRLNSDGSNIAEYLMDIRKKDRAIFDSILDTLQFALPYTRDLQPILTSELERVVYLQLTEGHASIPGWLLSTGTMRLVSILAVLRNPEPPPLIVIEEFENGLDPRTLYLLVEEIRNLVNNGNTQVIITTHSPYLLDLLSLTQIVVVERSGSGEPVFSRPADRPMLAEWSKTISPGKLYIGGKLSSVTAAESEDM
jgi:predicted ATPase